MLIRHLLRLGTVSSSVDTAVNNIEQALASLELMFTWEEKSKNEQDFWWLCNKEIKQSMELKKCGWIRIAIIGWAGMPLY